MANYGFSINVENLASAKMAEIEASLAKMGVKAEVETKKVAEHFEVMGERMGETFKNLKSLLLTGLGITALFEGWEFIENSKVAFEGLEKQIARVDTVLKSTNFKAGFSSEDIQDQAKEISKTIVNKRDEILAAQGTLLSYTNIRGNVFKEATKAVADYSTFFNTDLAGGARILGRALQDPIQGMNQLRRAGIVLTAQQKEQIKNYENQGQLVKAQAVLLDELNKKFGGQAAAFALTDAGKIQVAAKQWEELQFKLGEIISRVEVSLIPSFTKIVNVIKEAFNSTVIQYFIEHLKDLVSIVLKLLPIWLAYKAVMIANAAITALFSVENGILTASMGSLTIMTDGSTLAFEGFSAAIASTGIGALVVGLGLVIEKLITMNEELDTAIDKKYKLSENRDFFKQSADIAESIKERYAVIKSLSPSAQKSLATDIQQYLNTTTAKIPVINKRAQELNTGANKPLSPTFGDKLIGAAQLGGYSFTSFLSQNTQATLKTKEAAEEMNKNTKSFSPTFEAIKKIGQTLAKSGITPLSYTDPNNGIKGSSINTSNLSGASGGLGSSKIIQIHIDTFQKNIGVQESKSQADKTIEKLTELINSFSDSQNSQ